MLFRKTKSEEEICLEAEDLAKKEVMETLGRRMEELKNSPKEMDRFYQPIRDIVKSLENSPKIHCAIIEGDAGLGKSYNTQKCVSMKMGLLNTYSTPLEFYHFLYRHRKGYVIILDDIPNLLKDRICVGMLMAALWEPRVVTYKTTSKSLSVPTQFPIDSKVVILANSIPENIKPLLSRSLHLDLRFSHKERLALIEEYTKAKSFPVQIFNFIKDNANESHSIDLRLADKIYAIYNIHKDSNWQEIGKTQLANDSIMEIVLRLLKSKESAKEQIRKFMDMGYSRATYFNYKRKLRELR